MAISKEKLLEGLDCRVIGTKFFTFDEIDSTNTCAKTLAEAGMANGTVVFADHQTAGRGRNGRTWISRPEESLLFSVILRPELAKENSVFLIFYSSVSIARAVESLTDLHVECKWPNDLLLRGKKFCGILLENSLHQTKLDYSVIGVGINVNQSDFDDNLRDRATSLRKELNKILDRKKVLQAILKNMDDLLNDVNRGEFQSIMNEWNSRCSMFGKPVTVSRPHDQVFGTAVSLSPDGGLIIETSHGRSTVYAGDVSILTKEES